MHGFVKNVHLRAGLRPARISECSPVVENPLGDGEYEGDKIDLMISKERMMRALALDKPDKLPSPDVISLFSNQSR